MPTKPKPTPPPPRLRVAAFRLEAVIPVRELPASLVPPEPSSAGYPLVDVALEGSGLVMRAKLNGRSVRELQKTLHRNADLKTVRIEGILRPPKAKGEGEGEPLWLDSAILKPIGTEEEVSNAGATNCLDRPCFRIP
jgi:hypothetical protein